MTAQEFLSNITRAKHIILGLRDLRDEDAYTLQQIMLTAREIESTAGHHLGVLVQQSKALQDQLIHKPAGA